jgi:hypothetical protein
MPHLSLETLARLVDEAPEADEAVHLRSCLACRRELAALREQTGELAALPSLAPPPGAWEALEARLHREGLLGEAAPAAAPERVRVIALPQAAAPRFRVPLRAAAAVALFLLGGASGALLWDGMRGASGGNEPSLRVAQADGPVAGQAVLPPLEVGPPVVETLEFPQAEAAPARHPASFAAAGEGGRGVRPAPAPRRRPRLSPAAEQARRELERAQAGYLAALRRYAELADPASGADEATRLRALDGLVATTRAALDLAPGDPVINGYHLAAVQERDAMLRQAARRNESAWF